MATKPKSTLTFDQPLGPALPGAHQSSAMARALLHETQPASREMRAISRQVHSGLAIQVGIALKAGHAGHLAQTLTRNTEQRFAEHLAFERALLDKERHPQEQADLEEFCSKVRQDHSDSLRATRLAAVNAIEEVAFAPITLPEEEEDAAEIEVRPSLFGSLFGGTQVTRIKR